MDYWIGMVVLMTVCIAILAAGALKSRAEWLLNGCLRGVLGAVAIFFVNTWLEKQGITPGVGINPVTILTSAVLGLPGVAALYGIGFYGVYGGIL